MNSVVAHRRKFDIRPFGKSFATLEVRAHRAHVDFIAVINERHGMRVAHRNAGEIEIAKRGLNGGVFNEDLSFAGHGVERKRCRNLLRVEDGNAHIDCRGE